LSSHDSEYVLSEPIRCRRRYLLVKLRWCVYVYRRDAAKLLEESGSSLAVLDHEIPKPGVLALDICGLEQQVSGAAVFSYDKWATIQHVPVASFAFVYEDHALDDSVQIHTLVLVNLDHQFAEDQWSFDRNKSHFYLTVWIISAWLDVDFKKSHSNGSEPWPLCSFQFHWAINGGL
jgi:hypothetical protein